MDIEEILEKDESELTPEEIEEICDYYGGCDSCPHSTLLSDYYDNMTPGNFIGKVHVTVYWCDLKGEKLEFWD